MPWLFLQIFWLPNLELYQGNHFKITVQLAHMYVNTKLQLSLPSYLRILINLF